tara:strand:- start:11709 stop:11972 length:264 start_codon:yes stop_codon:yes gene_type:complete
MTPPGPFATDPDDHRSWWALAVSGGVPKRSLYVALVVGPILTLINQYDAIPGFGERSFDLLKAFLSFCVPYCVATYGAVTPRRAGGE